MKTFYKRGLIFLFSILCIISIESKLHAETYYVSNSGNDANSGTSTSEPWLTIEKVNSFKPNAGDQILFKRGDTWAGTIIINNSGSSGNPIVYGAYGDGENPIISGFETITGWTNEGDGIYSKVISPESAPNMLIIDGVQYAIGRYPNNTDLIYETANPNISITDNELSGTPNYTGAEVVVYKNGFSIERCLITDHTSNVITYIPVRQSSVDPSGRYFIQNSIETLDQFGEWFYNTSTNKLSVFFGNVDPSTKTTKVSVIDHLVSNTKEFDYISFEHIDLEGSNNASVWFRYRTENCSFTNCNLNFSGGDGFTMYGDNSRIENCSISNINGGNPDQTNGGGILMLGDNAVIKGNTVSNCGMVPGQTRRLTFSIGITISGNNTIVENNKVENVAYMGIYITAACETSIIRYNRVNLTSQLRHDAGAIYFNHPHQGTVADHNIVSNAGGVGIYLDETCTGVTLSNNTIFGSEDIGIKVHISNNNNVNNNHLYNNAKGINFTNWYTDSRLFDNYVFENVVAAKSGQFVTDFINRYGGENKAGKADRNYYIHPIDDDKVFAVNIVGDNEEKTFAAWKSDIKADSFSVVFPMNEGEYDLFYNESTSSKAIQLTYPMIDVKNNKYYSSITLKPFTSAILMKDPNPIEPDSVNPVITNFIVPANSSSFVIPVYSFTATDNKSVTGYMLTETDIAPLPEDAGWNTFAPASYTFNVQGNVTLYAWVKDLAGNVSESVAKTVNIQVDDLVKPVVTVFSIPSASPTLNVPVSSFIASDNKGVTGYMLTETATAPMAGSSNWDAFAPASYSFADEGTKTLYAWVKDDAGNVSESLSAQVVVTLPLYSFGNTSAFSSSNAAIWRRAMPVTFTENGYIQSISIYHNGGTGNVLLGVYSTDNSGEPGLLLGVTPSTPVNGSEGWQTVSLTSTVSVNSGQTVWLSWVFQKSVSVRYSSGTPGRAESGQSWSGGMPESFGSSSIGTTRFSVYCSYTKENNQPDVTKPIITAFNVPRLCLSLTLPVTNFTASDNEGVTGYILTESATAPLAGDAGWKTSAPTSYTFAEKGIKTLYAWVKDEAGNVSESIYSLVNISIPDVAKPVITNFSIPSVSSSLIVPINSFIATDDNEVIGYNLTETALGPFVEGAGWSNTAPTSYTFATPGAKTLYAWVKDEAGNISLSFVANVVINLTDDSIPVVTDFSVEPFYFTTLSVPITSFTAIDNKGITGYIITESITVPSYDDTGWSSLAPTSYTFPSEGVKNLYAWVKDADGNISNSKSERIIIYLPDLIKPEITDFNIPSASSSLNVPINSFDAIDNKFIAGYWLSESPNTPLAGDPGWKFIKPSTFNFTSEGAKTLYAWVRDLSGNVSESASGNVIIELPDDTKPVITDFNVPSATSTPIVPIYSFTATDNKGVTGYLVTETATAPLYGDTGWSNSAPASYAFTSGGTKTLYAWVKDDAGNVSESWSAQVTVSLSLYYAGNPDIYPESNAVAWRRAMPVTLNEDSYILGVAIYHNGGSGNMLLGVYTDNSGSPGTLLGVTPSTPANGAEGWQIVSLTNKVSVNSGQTVWLSWVFQNSLSVRFTSGSPGRAQSGETWNSGMPASFGASSIGTTKFSVVCIYSKQDNQPDITVPYITDFNIPSTASTLVVPINSFIAADNEGVTGYLLTESALAPLADDAGWSASAPTTYTFADEGTKTLYAWVKDEAGNVSESKSAQVNISIPDVEKPVITDFNIPSTVSTLIVPINSFIATDNKGVTDYLLTETAIAPLADDAGWSGSVPTTYTFADEGTKTLYAWAKDDAGNVSESLSAQVTITLVFSLGNTDVYPQSNAVIWRRALPVTFTENGYIQSISIYHNGGTGNMLLGVYNDNSGLPGSLLGVTSSTPVNGAEGWQTISLANTVYVNSGQTIWLSWVFQNGVSVRYTSGTPGRAQSGETWSSGMPASFGSSSIGSTKFSIYCIYSKQNNQPDVTVPVITEFNIPPTYSSLTLPINSFTAIDNIGITGYLLTETATAPLAGDAGWSGSAPESYTFADEGTKNLYAWVKDDAGNVSESKTAQVTITLPLLTLGNTDVYTQSNAVVWRRALPFTFSENGKIQSISIYHNGGAGNMLLGVYTDNSGLPGSLLGVTPSTPVNGTEGWQTISLTNSVKVNSGQTIWLAWVFQNGVSVRYTSGTPGRAQSDEIWSSGMPASFGVSTLGSTKFSIYCTYTPDESKSAEIVAKITPEVEQAGLKVYPNPFRDKLRFEFVSPLSVNARIDMYDLSGRMVKTIFEQPVEGGVKYEAEFRPVDEISGMYFYRMILGNDIINGKVIYKKE